MTEKPTTHKTFDYGFRWWLKILTLGIC
jgi:hypothetical protein